MHRCLTNSMNRKRAWKTCINAPEFHEISQIPSSAMPLKNEALTFALFIVWASFCVCCILGQAGEATKILFKLDFPCLQSPKTDQITNKEQYISCNLHATCTCKLPAFEVLPAKIEPASPATATMARQLARTGACPKILF